MRVKTLRKTNLVPSRYIKRGKVSVPVDARGSKTPLLKLPNSKGGGGGGGGTSGISWCGYAARFFKSRPLGNYVSRSERRQRRFPRQPYPIPDQNGPKSVPVFRPKRDKSLTL